MRNRILDGWNFMRVLRLVVGLIVVVQAVITKDILFGTLGGLFTLMPLLNIGCCGSAGCNVPTRRSNKEVKDISYEEVH